jgi:hypothetical protein
MIYLVHMIYSETKTNICYSIHNRNVSGCPVLLSQEKHRLFCKIIRVSVPTKYTNLVLVSNNIK